MSGDALLVLTTCAGPSEARSLAERLVGERLAACVNRIDSIGSTYRWQGKVEHAEESLLLIKTTDERLAAVEAEIRGVSSYELPEIIAVRLAAGSQDYLDWIRASVRSEQA